MRRILSFLLMAMVWAIPGSRILFKAAVSGLVASLSWYIFEGWGWHALDYLARTGDPASILTVYVWSFASAVAVMVYVWGKLPDLVDWEQHTVNDLLNVVDALKATAGKPKGQSQTPQAAATALLCMLTAPATLHAASQSAVQSQEVAQSHSDTMILSDAQYFPEYFTDPHDLKARMVVDQAALAQELGERRRAAFGGLVETPDNHGSKSVPSASQAYAQTLQADALHLRRLVFDGMWVVIPFCFRFALLTGVFMVALHGILFLIRRVYIGGAGVTRETASRAVRFEK